MVTLKNHMRSAIAVVLICAAICAIFSRFHFAAAHNFAEPRMPLDAFGVEEIYCSPKIESPSRSVGNLRYLLFRQGEVSVYLCFIEPLWIDHCVCQPIRSGYAINFGVGFGISSNFGVGARSDVICRSTAKISDYKMSFSRLPRDQFRWPCRGDFNVSAELTYFRILSDLSGIFCGFCEPSSRLDGVLGIDAGNFHFNQLAAHRIPLEQRGEERQNSYPSDYSGPNDQLTSDRREMPRFPYKRIFLGICVIGLGWICLWFSFESFEKISKSPRYLAGGIIFGMTAIALIGHGLFYACLGVWGLPSLYVL
jgi:hypothetical protein